MYGMNNHIKSIDWW